MPTPQPGIFAVGTRSHHHLEFALTGAASDAIAAISRIRESATTVSGVNVVVGFGPGVLPDAPTFTDIVGDDGYRIPGTQADIWLWLHGAAPDAVFNVARTSALALTNIATVVREQGCFTYQASQDLTGFEDGTENPPLEEAVTVATSDGTSIALVQKWVHDLDGFEALELADREQVIGRTLQGSEELDPSPENSHVGRVVIEDAEGEELEVFRRSTAFGGVLEHGLMFVAFSADQDRAQRMLENMAGVGDGIRDRLTDFSTPVSGAWYIVPSLDALRALGE